VKKIAVVLCGSGFKDGSEIREAVGVLWALSAEGAEVSCFAPDEFQADVVNCLTGKPAEGERRNQLVEAARIARGAIRPLKELKASGFQGLVLPGGFGVAKNLCTFANEGSMGKVNPEMARVLDEFVGAHKPVGAVCIAPALLALAFKGKDFELTLGAPSEASAEIEKLGHKHVPKQASEWHVDKRHKVVTSPAYMCDDAPLHEIFEGIRGLVHSLCQLA
jgi:enhancing lycopene biosynthesis protein 2